MAFIFFAFVLVDIYKANHGPFVVEKLLLLFVLFLKVVMVKDSW